MVHAFVATWPRVLKNRPVQIVLARPLIDDGNYKDLCLFTTDLNEAPEWAIETYALRPAIETAFRSSKQAMQISRPKHWSQTSIEKLAPWVWLSQTMIVVWYLAEGRKTSEAQQAKEGMGEWESEWSLEFIIRLLRRLIIKQTINATTQRKDELRILCDRLENYLFMAS